MIEVTSSSMPTATLETEVKTVTEDLAKPLDDNMVRQMVLQAEKAGEDVAAATLANAQTLPSGVADPTQSTVPSVTVQPVPQASTAVPQKFLKPDGTVDVNKLKASTEQLNEGIQQKQQLQEKTVDDYVREYREKERQFSSMPSRPEVIRQQFAQQANLPPPSPQQAPNPHDEMARVRAEIQRDLQVDPVGTILGLIKAGTEKELEPILKDRMAQQESARDNAIRQNLGEIAVNDRRILDPNVFQAVNQELNADPGYWNLRNPHLAAWSIVKERLRLGSPQQPAQPGRPPSPILGGGTPPPVPSASGAITPQALTAAIPHAKTANEQAALEQQIRAMLAGLDR